jgi:hypothetical protein
VLCAKPEDAYERAVRRRASLFVECLSFPDKLAYLSVAGTPDSRPDPDPKTVAMFRNLASIGMKLLHAPMIGAEIFVERLLGGG